MADGPRLTSFSGSSPVSFRLWRGDLFRRSDSMTMAGVMQFRPWFYVVVGSHSSLLDSRCVNEGAYISNL